MEMGKLYTLDIEILISECVISAAQYGDFSMFNATPREQAHRFGMIHPMWKSKYFSKLKASKLSNETALFLPKRVIPWVGFEFDSHLSKSFDIASKWLKAPSNLGTAQARPKLQNRKFWNTMNNALNY
ncbi:hypothetical protein HDU77_006541 [Chytriomyces hyalinus]|nr:hypothetical protein HDU77_006541 [Chytriomyces hyalinus]